MKETLNLHNDISEVPQLAEWIENIGETLGLEMSAVFQLNLALEEAVVNVMSYAYPDKEGMPVSLTVEDEDNKLVFTLKDNGVPFDPTATVDPDITLSAEDRDIGGLGNFLVRQIMTTVSYERNEDTNILTMTYNI